MKTTLNVKSEFGRTDLAQYIAYTWQTYNQQRQTIREQWKELRDYVFATDTSTTEAGELPWKNRTTVPKLCQIRDNLHSNYVSALFPNDQWMRWEAYSLEDGTKDKADAIQAYMSNKTRVSNFRNVIDQQLYDYIDYGNVFGTVDFVNSNVVGSDGNKVLNYQGPVVVRISPYDIVFDPLAASFEDSWKIVRAIRTTGQIASIAQENPDNAKWAEAIEKRQRLKQALKNYAIEDQDKAQGFMMDGYGNYNEYLNSGYVELLTFYGDYYNEESGELLTGRKIVVMDRMWVVENEPYDNWLGHAPLYHVGWRKRPDNLWAMGPLDNLVGMQYRLDHLENAKSDAMDLAIMPPLKIKGEVEAFEWKPNAEIHLDENGDVEELARNVQWVLQADASIERLMMQMEQFAGSPREAMGIRSPGEKTALEVRELQNAAGRIFQEKITQFEIEYLEKILNAMLETAKRNMDRADVVKVIDNSLGVQLFQEVTKEDITASGLIRPVGARHFAAQSQLVQNLTQISATPVWQQITPHVSSIALAELVEDVMGLSRFKLFTPNIAVTEQADTQRQLNATGEQLQAEQSTPPPM